MSRRELTVILDGVVTFAGLAMCSVVAVALAYAFKNSDIDNAILLALLTH